MSDSFDSILDQTFFGMDVATMLGGIADFLVFSESNLSWQREREIRRAQKEADEVHFEGDDARHEAQYRHQIVEGAEYRFDVILTQRVRYAALTALTTTIEWSVFALAGRVTSAIQKKPNGTNKAVHILQTLNSLGSFAYNDKIDFIERLIHVRNCVVHGAGLVESHDYPEQLRTSLQSMSGMRLSKKNFLGESVEIDYGTLEAILGEVTKWIPELEEQCYKAGLVK